MEKKQGFVAACKGFFGMKPGQTLAEFRDEIKALTAKDKQDIFEGFQNHDPVIECDAPAA